MMTELDAGQCAVGVLIEPIIWRRELQAAWGCCAETIRRRIKGGVLPPPDLGPRNQGWYASTLAGAGVKLAAASPQTTEASAA